MCRMKEKEEQKMKREMSTLLKICSGSPFPLPQLATGGETGDSVCVCNSCNSVSVCECVCAGVLIYSKSTFDVYNISVYCNTVCSFNGKRNT